MSSAFAWPPGGCCCGPPWFFDVQGYGWDQDTTPGANHGMFVRTCSLFPVATTRGQHNLNTYNVGNWFIDPTVPVGPIAGYCADGYVTWGFGRRTDQQDSPYQMFAFDIRNQALLFTTQNFPMSFGGGPGTDFIKPGPDGAIASYGETQDPTRPSRLYTAHKTGAIDTHDFQSLFWLAESNTVWEQIEQEAFLDWPHVLSTHRRNVSGSIFDNSTNGGVVLDALFQIKPPYFVEFYASELATANSAPWLAATNKRLLRRVDYQAVQGSPIPSAVPLGYDSFGGHDAACLWYHTVVDGSASRTELIIDGQSVVSVDNPLSGRNYFQPFQLGTPHVCYAHETLGGGYVAVMHKANNDSINVNKLFELHVYKNGSLVWKTDSGHKMSSIHGSTDRWIYFSGSPVSQSVFESVTHGKTLVSAIPGVDPFSKTRFWMARHDGSEVLPWNVRLSDTFGQLEEVFGYNPVAIGPFIRDSTTVPNSMPASYQEMYDHRHDV
jgi:hypothetical protein